MSAPATIAVTDEGWYDFLVQRPEIQEINFWKPSPRRAYRAPALSPFLFKLKAPHNAICGFAYFARYSRLPPWLAWEVFGSGNGCESFEELELRLREIRARIRYQPGPGPDLIGCILLVQPVFFPRDAWVRQPLDWPARTQTNKAYDLSAREGARPWAECLEAARAGTESPPALAGVGHETLGKYGAPYLVKPRLGQGVFRIAVTEAYEGACAITGEHSLPALEAGHIRPFAKGGPNEVPNGLLLRADLHRLFDRGYLTVTPVGDVEISARLRDDFQNGHSYYPLHGGSLKIPRDRREQPSDDYLRWHNENVFVA